MRSMRSTLAPAILAMIWIAGCGSKTGLDVPPLPPCTIDPTPAPIEACEEWTLGSPQLLDGDDVWSLRATPHAGGAAVAYSVRSEAEGRHEVRALAVGDDGRALGSSLVVVSAEDTRGWMTPEPSITGGCELHVLGRLASFDDGGVTVDQSAGLGIIAADGYARTIGLAPDEDVWDLRASDDELTWLADRLAGPGRLQLVRADRRGRELERTPIRADRVTLGVTRRHMLEGGGFALVTADYDAEETRASIFAANGEVLTQRALSERALGDSGSVEREGVGWLAWSDRPPTTGLVLAEPDALHLARLRVDGTTAEIVSLELGTVRPTTTWAIAWRGGAYLVPVIDDERGYVGVFSETGAPLALLDFGARFEAAEIVATDRGAMVVASERIDPRFAGTRLVARALTCVR